MRAGLVMTMALALAWSAAAQQAPIPKAPHEKLMAADTNKDGKVNFDELSAARPGMTQERFKVLDRNGDGLLSPEDRAPKAQGQALATSPRGDQQNLGARVKACDTDADGRVTPEEFKAGFPKAPRERFAKLDRNQDGVLTTADAPRKPATGHAGDAPHDMAAKLRKADADGDGKVTFEEASTAKPGLERGAFDRLDTNKDGALTQADVRSGKPEQARHGEAGQKLHAADTNKDGRVSWEEAQKAMPKLTRERFDHLDRNGDGFIAKDDRVKQP